MSGRGDGPLGEVGTGPKGGGRLPRRSPPKKKKKVADRNRGTDILFSKVVRARGACERCGGPPEECAHIIRRRFLRTRWLLDNAWALCHDCHTAVDENAVYFTGLVSKTIGAARFQELHGLAHDVTTPKPDRAAIRADLRERLKGLL